MSGQDVDAITNERTCFTRPSRKVKNSRETTQPMKGPESFEDYLTIGCMRCSKGGTDRCKVLPFVDELRHLQTLLAETDLVEEMKWSMPAYTLGGKNVIMLAAFVEHASLSFFKGAIVDDPKGLLVKAGENTQASRQLRFTSVEQILEHEDDIRSLIATAIDVERRGLKVERVRHEVAACEELQTKFDAEPVFKAAFEALTPGRQRGYHMHFNQAKQAKTREARIAKFEQAILEGKGMHDDHRKK
jgi:uncharacterized protein YdeI (YjbR/CyaY-like superfamily)